MNYSNVVIFIAAFTISVIFFVSVFINLQIKTSKLEVYKLYDDVNAIKNDIKRQRIEIATLTNPKLILRYINENNMQPVPVDNVNIIKIERKLKKSKKNE